jgi:hypothetical protein
MGDMKIARYVGMILGSAALGLLPAIASADTVFASFEDTPGAGASVAPAVSDPADNYYTYSSGAILDGWTVLGDGVDVIVATNFTPQFSQASWYPDGSHAVDLNAKDTGGLSQDFTHLSPNGNYTLSFYLTGNSVSSGPPPFGNPNNSEPVDLQVKVNNVVQSDVQEAFTDTHWIHYTLPVVASPTGEANITFQSQTAAAQGPVIDAIGLAAPLPEAGIAGAALLGGIAAFRGFRRKRIACQ